MRTRPILLVACVWIGALVMLQADAPQRPSRTAARQRATQPLPASDRAAFEPTLTQYCVTCHNERLKTGGLVLDPQSLGSVAAQADQWEKVVRKLRAGLMPPPGMPRPPDDRLNGLAGWLEEELDRVAST